MVVVPFIGGSRWLNLACSISFRKCLVLIFRALVSIGRTILRLRLMRVILIPVMVDEVLPGDTFNCHMTAFGRLATPLHPFMDNMFLDTFFFFVPNRLLWTNWQKFMGEQANPGDSTDFLIPQIVSPVGGYVNGSVYDYMGLPTQVPVFLILHCGYVLIT